MNREQTDQLYRVTLKLLPYFDVYRCIGDGGEWGILWTPITVEDQFVCTAWSQNEWLGKLAAPLQRDFNPNGEWSKRVVTHASYPSSTKQIAFFECGHDTIRHLSPSMGQSRFLNIGEIAPCSRCLSEGVGFSMEMVNYHSG